MYEHVTVRAGGTVDHGRLIERTTEHVLIVSDRPGRIAANPVREYAADVAVTFDDPESVARQGM